MKSIKKINKAKTKDTQITSENENTHLTNLSYLLFEIGSLRKIPRAHRQNLLTNDVSDNLSSHLYRVIWIGYLLAKEVGADAHKVMLMCMLHDLPEARSGDMNWINKKYIIEHGHKIFPHQSIQNPRFLSINRLLKIDKIIRHSFEKFIIKNFGIDTYNKFTKHLSKKVIEYTKKNIKNNEVLIIGHTHRPEVRLEHNYISSGIIGHGAAQYILIDENEIKLIKETY